MDVVAPATFYRAVETWPATANDFLSDAARGRPMRPPQRQNPIIYHGISVFATRAALEKRRRDVTAAGHRFPPLTVELSIPEGSGVSIHKTLGPDHYTVVGDPDVLLGLVVRLL